MRCSDGHTYSFSGKLGVQEVLRFPSPLLWRHLERKTPNWSDLLVTGCHMEENGELLGSSDGLWISSRIASFGPV